MDYRINYGNTLFMVNGVRSEYRRCVYPRFWDIHHDQGDQYDSSFLEDWLVGWLVNYEGM